MSRVRQMESQKAGKQLKQGAYVHKPGKSCNKKKRK